MGKLAPIPRRALPDRAVLVRGGDGAWQDGEEERVALQHVRLSGGVRGSWSAGSEEQSGRQRVLYFDACHSEPAGQCFAVGDFVEVPEDGGVARYRVRGVRAVRGDVYSGAVHHWEVELV